MSKPAAASGNRAGLGERLVQIAPEKLFALAAGLAGFILIGVIPPLAGGNEELNFQRAASISAGQLLPGPTELPGGIADLLTITHATFAEGSKPPLSYSRQQFDQVASLKLRAEEPKAVAPNPIAVLNPISYLPQVLAIAVGVAMGLSPLAIFYAGRIAGLIAGIALTFFAIRIMPAHKHSLAGIALLPPFLFSRSTFDADQFTNGLAFLVLATIIREIGAERRIRPGTVSALAFGAFLLAQAKSAYFLLPLQAFAIPVSRFVSRTSKTVVCAIICIPGIVASLGWMLLLHGGYFAGLRYRTWSGIVDPDAQVQLVLSHPLAFAGTLVHTVFGTAFIPNAVVGLLGVFGPPVMLPIAVILVIGFLLAATAIAEDRVDEPQLRSGATRALAAVISIATVALILTLLYLQWTRFEGPVIDGFSGRYLYPMAPLILLLFGATGRPVLRLSTSAWLTMLALVSAGATIWMAWQTYLG